jgi:hypothetical protein
MAVWRPFNQNVLLSDLPRQVGFGVCHAIFNHQLATLRNLGRIHKPSYSEKQCKHSNELEKQVHSKSLSSSTPIITRRLQIANDPSHTLGIIFLPNITDSGYTLI